MGNRYLKIENRKMGEIENGEMGKQLDGIYNTVIKSHGFLIRIF